MNSQTLQRPRDRRPAPGDGRHNPDGPHDQDRQDEDRPLTSAEAADWLKVSLSTLYHWQADGIGPKKKRVGKYSMYLLPDLRAFVAACEDDR